MGSSLSANTAGTDPAAARSTSERRPAVRFDHSPISFSNRQAGTRAWANSAAAHVVLGPSGPAENTRARIGESTSSGRYCP